MTDEEVYERIDGFTPGGVGGDIQCLASDLDVSMWVEPKAMCYSVGCDGRTRIYRACVNYGPFTSIVASRLWMQKGARVVHIDGDTEVESRVPGSSSGRRVNWDSSSLRAAKAQMQDDCMCEWSTSTDTGTVMKATTQTKIATARF